MNWWRAYHGISTDPKYQVVLRHIASHRVTSRHAESPGVRLSDISSVWVWLVDFASQNQPRGSIDGFQVDHIAVATGLPDDDVEAIIEGFRWRKMISGNLLTAFEKRQPSSTFRMQEKRDRDKVGHTASHGVTPRHAASHGVTPLARDARSPSKSSSINQVVYSSEEVLIDKKPDSQHQSIDVVFKAVVGRAMKKIDVDCLSRLSKLYSDQQIEAGIYVAGARAAGLGKKPGSLAYFEGEIEKVAKSEIADLKRYIAYAKKKFNQAKES